jgi:hypothetical protein
MERDLISLSMYRPEMTYINPGIFAKSWPSIYKDSVERSGGKGQIN